MGEREGKHVWRWLVGASGSLVERIGRYVLDGS